jgi:hypothetical protein
VTLSESQVLSLAPDDATRKSGRDLATSSKWLLKKANDTALWGECQGSGSKPYQTAIDLTDIAFKCSCPSRKFPCKHGVALGIIFSRDQSFQSQQHEAPGWVKEWVEKRAQKSVPKAETREKPVDEAAQAKRFAAREQKVADGVEEVLRWIKDIIRNGLISIPEKSPSFFEGMARRLVDAQAPGIAGMVKALGNIPVFKEGWETVFLNALLDIYLLAKGYQNKDNLSTGLQQELRNLIGFTTSQEELKSQSGLLDTWLIAGKQVTSEENVVVERNWLYGINSGKAALVLQFIVNGQGSGLYLTPGTCIEAELVYFPSVSPLRAIIKRQILSEQPATVRVQPSWNEILEADGALAATFPLRGERPYPVAALSPVRDGASWWLQDEQGNQVQVKDGFTGIWKLLAISGGNPLDMMVIGKESSYQPLGAWANGTYKSF